MKLTIAIPSLILCLSSLASARTIEWGNGVFDTNLDSAGFAIDNTYTFAIGTFGTADLTLLPVDQWAANWKVLDTSTYNTNDDIIPGKPNNKFGGEAILKDNAIFAVGEKVYIWVYNSQAPVEGSQWAIFTNSDLAVTSDNWTIPVAPGNQTDLPIQMFRSQANSIPYGGVNSVQGPGEHTSSPPTFSLQTHTFIPEADPSLLLGLTGALFILRRRKH